MYNYVYPTTRLKYMPLPIDPLPHPKQKVFVFLWLGKRVRCSLQMLSRDALFYSSFSHSIFYSVLFDFVTCWMLTSLRLYYYFRLLQANPINRQTGGDCRYLALETAGSYFMFTQRQQRYFTLNSADGEPSEIQTTFRPFIEAGPKLLSPSALLVFLKQLAHIPPRAKTNPRIYHMLPRYFRHRSCTNQSFVLFTQQHP